MPAPLVWEVIVVGAGPAGLSAALYAARFRRRTLVIHDGSSRALRIPKTRNVPGFDRGIAGRDLIARMLRHARRYGASIEQANVAHATRDSRGFRLESAEGRTWSARSLVLATGVELNEIGIPRLLHEEAIRANVLRYCPVCDGYEHIGQRVAVIGCDTQGAAEALFLRRFTDDVTLLPRSFAELGESERARLREAGVAVCELPVAGYRLGREKLLVELTGRDEPAAFDVVYPALGVRPRNELARELGLAVNEQGCLAADAPGGTPVAGLFAAGDSVEGLDQISVAFGHGAIAGTRAHNWLREQDDQTV